MCFVYPTRGHLRVLNLARGLRFATPDLYQRRQNNFWFHSPNLIANVPGCVYVRQAEICLILQYDTYYHYLFICYHTSGVTYKYFKLCYLYMSNYPLFLFSLLSLSYYLLLRYQMYKTWMSKIGNKLYR